uniref:Putative ovule protein n=1 Tax=Solanum chacoense TaxID=4108 RepID=A0A0V0GXD6_SOLCH
MLHIYNIWETYNVRSSRVIEHVVHISILLQEVYNLGTRLISIPLIQILPQRRKRGVYSEPSITSLPKG